MEGTPGARPTIEDAEARGLNKEELSVGLMVGHIEPANTDTVLEFGVNTANQILAADLRKREAAAFVAVRKLSGQTQRKARLIAALKAADSPEEAEEEK
ncbi:MAG: hypothetical protein WC604_02075 [Candidatus Gracilibacteria bacterium]